MKFLSSDRMTVDITRACIVFDQYEWRFLAFACTYDTLEFSPIVSRRIVLKKKLSCVKTSHLVLFDLSDYVLVIMGVMVRRAVSRTTLLHFLARGFGGICFL